MLGDEYIGQKRPLAPNNTNFPRKRPPVEGEDDLVDQAFEMDVEDEPIPSSDDIVLDDSLGEAGKNWQRPAPKAIDPGSEPLIFQQFEVDYTVSTPNSVFYQSQLKEAPIVRMFGVNESGVLRLLSFDFRNCLTTNRLEEFRISVSIDDCINEMPR